MQRSQSLEIFFKNIFQALHPDEDDSGNEGDAGEEENAEEPGMYDDADEDFNGGGDNGPEQMDAD